MQLNKTGPVVTKMRLKLDNIKGEAKSQKGACFISTPRDWQRCQWWSVLTSDWLWQVDNILWLTYSSLTFLHIAWYHIILLSSKQPFSHQGKITACFSRLRVHWITWTMITPLVKKREADNFVISTYIEHLDFQKTSNETPVDKMEITIMCRVMICE